MHSYTANSAMLKICSTFVKMISTCCELNTTQEAFYSTIMNLLWLNIAHAHKTVSKLIRLIESLYLTSYNWRRIIALWRRRLWYTYTKLSLIAMICLHLWRYFSRSSMQATLSMSPALVRINAFKYLQPLPWKSTYKGIFASVVSSYLVSLYSELFHTYFIPLHGLALHF